MGIAQMGTFGLGERESTAAQVGSAQMGIAQMGTALEGIAQMGIAQTRIALMGIALMGIAQVSLRKWVLPLGCANVQLRVGHHPLRV